MFYYFVETESQCPLLHTKQERKGKSQCTWLWFKSPGTQYEPNEDAKQKQKNRNVCIKARSRTKTEVVAGCPHHKDNHIGGLWKQLITTRFLLGSDLQQQQRRQWSNLPVQSFRCEDMLGFHEQVMILLLSTQEQTAVLHSQVEGRV